MSAMSRVVVASSFVAAVAMNGCGDDAKAGADAAAGGGAGGNGGNGADGGATGTETAAQRAACYPPCLANLIEVCPLIGACTADAEPSGSVALPGETQGSAICFASGERERNAISGDSFAVVYVDAPDGSECYAAVGEVGPAGEIWDLSAGGQLFGELTRNPGTGAVAVSCDGATTQIDVTNGDCGGLPWQNAAPCDPGQSCSFGTVPSPGVWDGGAPCDPTQCTTPPQAACQVDATTGRRSVVSSDGAPTCDNVTGCAYPKQVAACDHGCYAAQCTGALASISDVQGKHTASDGTSMPVSITAGAVPANNPITVTARTSPRGAAASLDLHYGTCTAGTLCVMTSTLFMSPDPATPADQSDYDQWTVNVPPQTPGTKVEFQLQATGAGDSSSMISQASPGVPWSYTAN
jgi:hypothetical protein